MSNDINPASPSNNPKNKDYDDNPRLRLRLMGYTLCQSLGTLSPINITLLVMIEMGFAQGRRPLCFFSAEGSSQHIARSVASARGGSGGMSTLVLCNAPRSQPWPPQASRAGTLASPHAPPRIDAYTSCVYVSYTCVCVCASMSLSKVLSLGSGLGSGLGPG